MDSKILFDVIPDVLPPTRICIDDNIFTDSDIQEIFAEEIEKEIKREIKLRLGENINEME